MKLFLMLLSLFLFTSHVNSANLRRIAVIDTGLDVNDIRFKSLICGYKDFTNTTINDVNGHGTHVTGLIKQYAGSSGYCFVILKFYLDSNKGFQNMENLINSYSEAIRQKVDVINFSGGGPDPSEKEYWLIRDNPSIKFIVAAGNNNQDICLPESSYYPASYFSNNIIVVGALNNNGDKLPSSNYGCKVNVWEIGENVLSDAPGPNQFAYLSGTSMSTAIHTGKYLKELFLND